MKVVSISNNKGGVGKTTTTINLAVALTKLGKRVMMIDLDSQASLSVYLGYEADTLEFTSYDLIMQKVKPQNIIQYINPDLALIPSSVALGGAVIDLISNSITQNKNMLTSLTEALKPIQDFDYILIDCPPDLGVLTLNAMITSDYVIAPIEPEFLALKGFDVLMRTIEVAKGVNLKLELMGVLISKFRSVTSQHSIVSEGLRQNYKCFTTVIKNYIKIADASTSKLSMLDYAPTHETSLAYMDLAREVINYGK